MGDSTLVAATETGFQAIDLADDIKQSAIGHLREWIETDKFAGLVVPSAYRPLIEWMVESENFDLLLDSFYQVIPFGTGGCRGPVGIGPNRINPYTIASSIQGHVEYLRQQLGNDTELKVVVAYDVRVFNNLRGTYPAGLPNPLLGLRSKDLAHIAASVYCAAGVIVYMLPDEPADFISTPELSFLIRRYGAHGGLNMSASHNHPDDNGGKFYNKDGGQEIPPNDEEMVRIVETISDVKSIPYDEVIGSSLVCAITDEDRRAYIDLNLGLRLEPSAGLAKFVFTGLHGTGLNTVGRCLREMGYQEGEQFFVVEEQREFRGDFKNVMFRSPNPEVPEALELGMRYANQVDGDLLLATDPDADRLGGAAPLGDAFAFINGNEFAVLLTRYRLESLKRVGRLPARPLGIKTQVTTELVTRLIESYDGVVIGDLLVGFKYVGDILGQIEKTGRFRDIEASLDDFIIGAEESHGLLMTPEIRDKDAAGAAVILAELTSELKARGETVYGYLIDTYKRYGYFRNSLRSTVMQGAAGSTDIRKIQQAMRAHPPSEIAGRRVLNVIDYWDEAQFGPFVSETDRGSRDLITYLLEGGMKATIRPSGTEPKNKIYLELGSEPLGADADDAAFDALRAKIDREVREFSNAFLGMMLSIVGVDLPDYSLEISDLVSLPNKVHFGEKFIPEFEGRAEEVLTGATGDAAVAEWIDKTLAPYGPDARVLVRDGFTAYANSQTDSERLRAQRRIFGDS
jgi:phosphoglucomutase